MLPVCVGLPLQDESCPPSGSATSITYILWIHPGKGQPGVSRQLSRETLSHLPLHAVIPFSGLQSWWRQLAHMQAFQQLWKVPIPSYHEGLICFLSLSFHKLHHTVGPEGDYQLSCTCPAANKRAQEVMEIRTKREGSQRVGICAPSTEGTLQKM